MKIDFNNQWYREMCLENGLDPDNELSKSTVALAFQCSVKMKKYIDALENYKHHENKELNKQLQERLDYWNNERIKHMLNALFYAEVMAGLGPQFNEFVKRKLTRKQTLLLPK